MTLHDACPTPDHEPAGGLLGDALLERSPGVGELAADRQGVSSVDLEPFLHVVIEAVRPDTGPSASILSSNAE